MEIKDKVIEILENMKIYNIKSYRFDKVMSEIEYIVVGSATNKIQAMAASEEVYDYFRKNDYNTKLQANKDSGWLVVSINDVLVHVFLESERAFYQVDELWSKQ